MVEQRKAQRKRNPGRRKEDIKAERLKKQLEVWRGILLLIMATLSAVLVFGINAYNKIQEATLQWDVTKMRIETERWQLMEKQAARKK